MFQAEFNTWEWADTPASNFTPVGPPWMLNNNANLFGNYLCSNSFSTNGQNPATSYQPIYIPQMPCLGMAYVCVYRYLPQVYIGSGGYVQNSSLPLLNNQVQNFMDNPEVTNNISNYSQGPVKITPNLSERIKVSLRTRYKSINNRRYSEWLINYLRIFESRYLALAS